MQRGQEAKIIATQALPDDDSRREPVLATAARMFIERGYLGTSLDDIAGALGSTKGRIYHYFSSKADLYLAVHHAAMRIMIDSVAPLAALSLPPAERLRQMAAAQLRLAMQAGPIQKAGMIGLQPRTIKITTPRQKRALAGVLGMRDEYERMFGDVIREGITAGVFADRPAHILTKPLQGALNWAHVWFDPSRRSTQQELENLIAVIADYAIGGLYPHPEPSPRTALPVAESSAADPVRPRRKAAARA